MRIGIVTTWFERGAAYVSRAYRDVLRLSGCKVFIYARDEKYDIGNPIWDTPDVTWGKKTSDNITKSIDKEDFIAWIKNNNIKYIIFNEQVLIDPVFWAKECGCIVISYIDYYTENTIPYFIFYDGLICNTLRHYEVFSWHPQCIYIPWGTDINTFKPNYDNKNTYPVFFHSAGMNPYRKGTDYLLEAFSLVQGKCKLVIHIQGIGLSKIPSSKYIADDLTKRGRLAIVNKEIGAPGLYNNFDVYVYPSRLDGIGLTVAEALASGLPVIVPDNPPMNEFVTPATGKAVKIRKNFSRKDGYYWPENSVDILELSKAMQYYVDNFDKMSFYRQQARKYAEENLDWQKNANHLAKWMKKLLSIPGKNDLISPEFFNAILF